MTKVLMISTDREVFKEGSAVRERLVALGDLVDQLDVIVFSLKKNNFKQFKVSAKVTVYPTNNLSRLTYISSAFWLGKKIGRPTLITCQDPFETGLAGWLLAQWFRTGLELQIHTDFLAPAFRRESGLNRLRHNLGRLLLSEASHTRVVSERIKNSLINNKIVLAKPVLVLPIFTEATKFSQPIKIDLHQQYSQFKQIILVASRLTREKQIDLAIKALAVALKTNPDLGLVIAGTGPLEGELKALARQLGVESKVIFAGWIADLTDLYRTADLFLLTSAYEGYGLTLLEASFAGLPIVATDVGVASEVGAAIVKPEPAALAAAMIKELNSREIKAPTNLPMVSKSEYLAAISHAWHDDVSFNRGGKVKRFFKYLIAGGSAAVLDLFLLHVFTDWVGIWYLYSAIWAFLVALVVSFILQKFWVFRDHSLKTVHIQAVMHSGLGIFNTLANTVLMYLLVDGAGIHYLIAQVIGGAIIAVFNFFIYRGVIFKNGR